MLAKSKKRANRLEKKIYKILTLIFTQILEWNKK
jgi:hypothetical protein